MNEIIKYGASRFMKGLREAPREFLIPAIVAWRGVKFVFDKVDTAMNETRSESPTPRVAGTRK